MKKRPAKKGEWGSGKVTGGGSPYRGNRANVKTIRKR